MAARIDELPPEILARIFWQFRPFEWLLLEAVCRRWRIVAATQLWSRLQRIDEDGIGFPVFDFRRNFIQIARRIHSVERFVNPLRLASSSSRSKHETREETKPPTMDQLLAAMAELVRKRSADAVFPLDLIKELYDRGRCVDTSSSVRGCLFAAMKQYQAAEFSSIRLDKVLLHQKTRSENPLSVPYGDVEVLLPLKEARVSRVVIGVLVILLHDDGVYISRMQEMLSELAAWKTRFSSFANLDRVEIESVELAVAPRVIEESRGASECPQNEPLLSMRVGMVEGGCVLAVAEFRALLERLSPTRGAALNEDCLDMVRRWKSDGVVKSVAMRIHSDKFVVMEDMGVASTCSRSTSDEEPKAGGGESVQCIVAELFPDWVDRLFLTVSTSCKEGSHVAALLRRRGVPRRLKEYSVVYAEPMRSVIGGTRRGADSKAFLSEAYHFIRLVSDGMTQLEVLRLNLREGGTLCAFPKTKMNDVPTVTRPLPLLQLVEIDGFPCFPFLSSVVQHAVNLKQLTINCQPFSSDISGVPRVNKFLESMHWCRNIVYFSLKAWPHDDADLASTASAGYTQRRRKSEKFADMLKPMLAEMDNHVDRLATMMPKLVYISVVIARCKFRYEMDRRAP